MESVTLIRHYPNEDECIFEYQLPSDAYVECGSSMLRNYRWCRRISEPLDTESNQLKIDKQTSLPSSHRLSQLKTRAILGKRSNQPTMTMMRWNQSSDRLVASVQQSRTSRPRLAGSPGGSTPGGTGVDVKHGSYDRYLARKKYKNSLNKSKQCIVPNCT